MTTPVTNGCNGACCEAVFFPITVDELKLMRDALKVDPQARVYNKADGTIGRIMQDEVVSHDYLIDMIIELGWSPIDPESKKTFSETIKEHPEWDGVEITNERLGDGRRVTVEGIVEGNIVTCRHFDKEKRICNDYENRPGLCRRYACDGRKCGYEGCKINEVVDKLNEVTNENGTICGISNEDSCKAN